jgi:hypothetical protein
VRLHNNVKLGFVGLDGQNRTVRIKSIIEHDLVLGVVGILAQGSTKLKRAIRLDNIARRIANSRSRLGERRTGLVVKLVSNSSSPQIKSVQPSGLFQTTHHKVTASPGFRPVASRVINTMSSNLVR